MLRSSFLYLARASWAKYLLTHFPPTRYAARRFVAGDTLDEAIEAARRLNAKGLDVTLDHLGESVTDEASARAACQDYLAILEAIARSGVRATASLKLTQLGLDVSRDLCLENLRTILDKAGATGNHVTIDMESSDYTQVTLDIFHALRQDYDNVGIVIQAYLYRSADDMRALAAEGSFVRLCKGAYKEPADRAFPKKPAVDANFVALTRAFLTPALCESGGYLGVATHDAAMIDAAKTHVAANNIPRTCFEFQMLYGIRPGLQEDLAKAGYTVRLYVGYGTEWYPYYMRRLAERPANVWFMVSSLFRH